MQVKTINKLTPFGFQLSDKFLNAVYNQKNHYDKLYMFKNHNIGCYDDSGMNNPARKQEMNEYNNMVNKLKTCGDKNKTLNINDSGIIHLDSQNIEQTYKDKDGHECISFNTMKQIYEKLLKEKITPSNL